MVRQARHERTYVKPKASMVVMEEAAMRLRNLTRKILCAAVMLAAASAVSAQNVVKLGMVGEFSGPFAQYGQQILGGMKAYMKLHGDTVAGKKIEIVVADYGPGLDSEKAFSEAFKAAGGEIVGSIHTPLQNPDFAPFVQRVKDAKPEAVFLFLPAGEQGIAFMKGYAERGLAQAGIKLIATGDITDDGVLEAMGEPTLGRS